MSDKDVYESYREVYNQRHPPKEQLPAWEALTPEQKARMEEADKRLDDILDVRTDIQ